MKKWLVYVLGVITGVVLTFALALCVNLSKNSGIVGLELFDEPGEFMECSQLEVFQVVEGGCALANPNGSVTETVFIMPEEKQHFYDGQNIVIKKDQRVQRVGTFQYNTKRGIEKTVPAVRIIDGEKGLKFNEPDAAEDNSGITLFDKPGECVSRRNFEVQKVLESGDAIANEVTDSYNGYVVTSNLEVLILAQEGRSFYDKQIVKAPKGTCARQIGNYRYQKYGQTKVIPIVAFK